MPNCPDQSGYNPSPGPRPAMPGEDPARQRQVDNWRALGFALTFRAMLDSARLTVAGELTMVSAPLLDDAVTEIYRPDRDVAAPSQLVLDLTDVTFLDVMGVAALRRGHDRAVPRLRLGLPASAGPRRLLAVTVELGWMPPAFLPGIARPGPMTPAETARSRRDSRSSSARTDTPTVMEMLRLLRELKDDRATGQADRVRSWWLMSVLRARRRRAACGRVLLSRRYLRHVFELLQGWEPSGESVGRQREALLTLLNLMLLATVPTAGPDGRRRAGDQVGGP